MAGLNLARVGRKKETRYKPHSRQTYVVGGLKTQVT